MVGFLFGGNTGLNYEDLQNRRAAADALAKRIMGQQPKNTYEGIGALLTGAAAGIGRYRADREMKQGKDQASSQFNDILSKITGQPVASSASDLPLPGAASELAASSPAADVPNNGSTFSPFIETVKAGGLTNPYGLAAVAATGRAESGFSPANAARTWSDPSESGQAGTAGGVMSWRAERLQNLQRYAASKGEQGNGSPQTQAEFFMREDPQLVAQLNAAKSPEEAQALMNSAWKFAGYDRSGGEAGRRLGYANGYVSQFQGQGGQQVASLDPSAGMSGAAAIEQMAPGSGYVDPSVSAPNTSPPAPAFDAGRFADPINLAEMPANRADLPGGLQSQASAYAAQPPQQANPLPDLPTSNVAPAPQVAAAPQQQVAQAPQVPQYQVPQFQPYQMDPATLQFLANPFADEGQKQAVRMAVQQQMQAHNAAQEEATWRARQDYQQSLQDADPLRRAQIAALQAKTGQQDGEEWGLNPVWGKDKDGNTVLGQVSKGGKFKPLDTGEFQPTPGINTIDTGTQIITRDSRTGQTLSSADKQNRQEAADKAAGALEGKTREEVQAEYDSITSKMPGLYGVVDRLQDLANEATYTLAGQAVDFGRSQLGMSPRESAVARAEYTATVDNQILPLLKDTFGAQFTDAEGIRLARTLGDADKTPTEKQALLRAFIQQKERDVEALGARIGKQRTRDDQGGGPSVDDLLRKYGN